MTSRQKSCEIASIHEDVVREVTARLHAETPLNGAGEFFHVLGDATRV